MSISDNGQHYTSSGLEDVEIGYNFDNQTIEKKKLNVLRRNKIKLVITLTRIFLAIVIIIVVSVIGSTTYNILRTFECNSFKDQYASIYGVVNTRIDREITALLNSGNSLGNRYATELNSTTNSQFLIDKIGFENEYSKLQLLSVARAISFNPMILPGNLQNWETWAAGIITNNLNYYDISNQCVSSTPQCIRKNPNATPTTQNVACSIDPKHNVFFPVWQIAPIVSNKKAILFDLHSENNRCKALNDVIDNLGAACTDIIQLVQQDQSVTRPSSIIFQPVIVNNQLSGTVSIVFSWDSMFQDMIPSSISSLYLVFSSPILTYTWEVTNGVVNLLGKGDFHDSDYDKYQRNIAIDISTMHFSLNIYPSKKWVQSFYTTQPQTLTIVIVSVIVIIAMFFLALDYLQSKNSSNLEDEVTYKGGIIDQLFPSNVQDKLFNRKKSSKKFNGCSYSSDSSSRLSSYLNISSPKRGLCMSYDIEKEVLSHSVDPIAENYENITVLFADLVGFTSWCSDKKPEDVLRLLEGVFASFDRRARIRGVFKVETIGDCYMGCTGLPDSNDHHAETMADFALDIMEAIVKINNTKLQNNESINIQLRIGIASGPVTAGVVRADRARFQLFGDTVNLAARMEQNAIPGRIQVSESTYLLLTASNYDNVLTQREDKINAKGKGLLTTYWLTKSNNETSRKPHEPHKA